MNSRVPTTARVAVIGGGVAGCSVLYHLTRLGWSDVTLIERRDLTSGSTWHAAGLCTQFNPSLMLTKLLRYSIDLYSALDRETGGSVQFRQVGSVRLLSTPGHLDEVRQRQGVWDFLGIPYEVVDSKRLSELYPLANLDGIQAGLYLPTDGYVDPSGLVNAFAATAIANGASIHRGVSVLGLEKINGGAWKVMTDCGSLVADYVVNCGGIWARRLGELAGVRLPLVPIEHQYVVTERAPMLLSRDQELPVLRDPAGSFYIRQDGHRFLVGPFEREPIAWDPDEPADRFPERLLRPEIDRIASVLMEATSRVPSLDSVGIKSIVNGLDAYTPDGHCLMGEAPGIRNFHVLAGFSIFGIVFSGGAGKYEAEWIVNGQPDDSLWELDVSRFGGHAGSKSFLVAKAVDTYEREYAIRFPYEERMVGRPVKTSGLYDRLKARGAVFGERSGWERPLWFAPQGIEAKDELTFARPPWLRFVEKECIDVRNNVGVLDQTSFAKFEVSGSGASQFLDYLCANTLPKGIGRIALTQMLTKHGGIACDVTVTKIAPDAYYVVSAAATETHDQAWIERHLPGDVIVRLRNVTAQNAVLTLAGPRSRELLHRIAEGDVSNAAFPFFQAREINIGSAPVRALRLSFVGELGWELHHPIEYQRYVYDRILDAGQDLGIVDFGYRALDCMRLEKGYRLWGADISTDYTPFEAGLGRFVDLKKGDFLGRSALVSAVGAPLRTTLACLKLEPGDHVPHAFEPVLASGSIVGYVASGGYGPSVGAAIAYAYLPPSVAREGEKVTVQLAAGPQVSTISAVPLFDPQNVRMKQA